MQAPQHPFRGVRRFVRQFLVPSRQAFMSFRIRRAPPRDGGDAVGFLLEVDSAFLRLLVPSMLAVYDDRSRRLLHYEGLSNLRDAVRSDILSHLCDIAVRTGERIAWDPVKHQLVSGSTQARDMLQRQMRAPWTL